MIGNSRSGPGVMVLTMEALFEAIQSSELDKNCRVSMQYLEVYNETIRDLLIENSPSLQLTEDSTGVHITGLSEKFPKTASEVFCSYLFYNIRCLHS
jgi:kinesin family protein 18/19